MKDDLEQKLRQSLALGPELCRRARMSELEIIDGGKAVETCLGCGEPLGDDVEAHLKCVRPALPVPPEPHQRIATHWEQYSIGLQEAIAAALRPTFNAEELEQRKRESGSSDVAAMAGFNPYQSRIDLYLDKRADGPPPFEDSRPAQIGRVQEHVARTVFMIQERPGMTCEFGREIPKLLHAEDPRRSCHLDFVVHAGQTSLRTMLRQDGINLPVEPIEVVEVKSPRQAYKSKWGQVEDEEDGADIMARCQVLWAADILESQGILVGQRTVLCWAAGGHDLRPYDIPHDPKLLGLLVEAHDSFWWHMKQGVMPDPEETAAAAAALRRAYTGNDESVIVAREESILKDIAYARKWKSRRSTSTKGYDRRKPRILAFMKEAARLVDKDGNLLARRDKRGSLTIVLPKEKK